MPDGSFGRDHYTVETAFTSLAERLAEAAGDAVGKFVVTAYGACPTTGAKIAEVRHIENGPNAAEQIVIEAVALAAIPGANVYIMPALVRVDLAEGRKGGLLEEMIAWPVSPRVGNVKNDDPSLIEPIAGTG